MAKIFIQRFYFLYLIFIFPAMVQQPPVEAATPSAVTVEAAAVDIERFELASGLQFLVVERPAATITAAGWVVPSGSASDPLGKTGLAHFLEHMLFQGTSTIGTFDYPRERSILEKEREAARDLEQAIQSHKRGRIRVLKTELEALRQDLYGLTHFGELSALYTRAGGTGLDARTYEDLATFFVAIPAEAIELWFWLESDRLHQPVFRQRERERAVVLEERQRRIDGTPHGPFQERLLASFWQGTPYAWTSLGLAQDVERLTHDDLTRFFETQYTPERLTAVVVGPHRADDMRPLAERYFGRLSPRLTDLDDAETNTAKTLAGPHKTAGSHKTAESHTKAGSHKKARSHKKQRILRANGLGRPQWQFLYRTVPHGHPDAAPLEVLAGALDGPDGRLHRRLVVDSALATSAYALHHPLRHAGSFSVVTDATHDMTALRRGLDAEIERLQTEELVDREMQRIRNRLQAEHYRRLRDPMSLLQQMLIFAGLGDPDFLNTWPSALAAVTNADVRRVAQTYLTPERRVIGRYDHTPESRR